MATENRFNEGDVIHDIDGNTFDVEAGYARQRGASKRYNLDEYGLCFCYLNEFEQVPYVLRETAA